MTSPLKFLSSLSIPNGSVSAPAVRFTSNADTGIYYDSGYINITIDGVKKIGLSTLGLDISENFAAGNTYLLGDTFSGIGIMDGYEADQDILSIIKYTVNKDMRTTTGKIFTPLLVEAEFGSTIDHGKSDTIGTAACFTANAVGTNGYLDSVVGFYGLAYHDCFDSTTVAIGLHGRAESSPDITGGYLVGGYFATGDDDPTAPAFTRALAIYVGAHTSSGTPTGDIYGIYNEDQGEDFTASNRRLSMYTVGASVFEGFLGAQNQVDTVRVGITDVDYWNKYHGTTFTDTSYIFFDEDTVDINVLSASRITFTHSATTTTWTLSGNDHVIDVSDTLQIASTNTQTIGFWGATPVAQSTGWAATNVSTDKSFDANSTTVDELADVLGTLIDTLKTYGILGA